MLHFRVKFRLFLQHSCHGVSQVLLSIGSPRNLSSGVEKRDNAVTGNYEYSMHVGYI
jgi:hypothetical protein